MNTINEYGDDDWATPEKENIMKLKEQIINDIESNPIVLYMKGTKDMPMCGFSNSVVQILNHYGVEFKDVNVLEDPEIRVKLSEYSNWPTIPQLFINSELVGGADIAIEMHNSGELETVLDLCLADIDLEKNESIRD
jgi:monothiol glutaredoxin